MASQFHPDPHCRIGRVKPFGNIELFPGVFSPSLPARQQPDTLVIDMLDDLIARAERGEVQAIAYVIVRSNGATASSWTSSKAESSALLLGGITLLAHDYASHVMENSRIAADNPQDPA